MTTGPGPIRKKKLSHEVQERLLSLIQSDRLEPGDPLPSERELMQTYEVGRPAIREAMQNLERMGLVRIRHGERARITEPSIGRIVDEMSQTMRHMLTHSLGTMEHLKEARATFEMEMARIAARKRSDSDIERLQRRIDEQAAAGADFDRFLAGDAAFHREIALMSGNPIFAAVTEAMFRWLADFHVDLVRVPGLEALTVKEHRTILDAIASGSPDRAAKAMADHLNRANKLYNMANASPGG